MTSPFQQLKLCSALSTFTHARTLVDNHSHSHFCSPAQHNTLHHYRLGEDGDPDLVQRNLQFVREMRASKLVKYLGVLFLAATWKW